MKITRRQFIKTSAATGAVLATGGVGSILKPQKVYAFSQSPTNLRKFITALPGLGPSAANEIGQYLPVAVPNTTKYPGVDFYHIGMKKFKERLHPDLPKATKLWGYVDLTGKNGPPVSQYLGGVIVAKTGRPVRIKFSNNLPWKHILPIDNTIMGAETGQAQNRTAVHLHGGLVPWTSDGGPFAWFTPSDSMLQPFTHGPDWQAGDYWYPNGQSNRLVWYHDHAFGITRLNAYAGLASAYVITDQAEAQLIASNVIPNNRIPLVIQTKTFKTVADQWGDLGDLWYPSVYEDALTDSKGRWDRYSGPGILPLPYPSAVPEFFADTAMVNGACYPYLNVEPRRYRLQLLNGDQARVFNLQLYYAKSSDLNDPLSKEEDTTKPGPAFIQIGSEGGFLPAPVVLNNPPVKTQYDPVSGEAIFNGPSQYTLLLGGAERADIIVDFSTCQPGDILMLYNDAPAPYPGGDPRNDYYTGNTDFTGIGGAPSTKPGFGPNTRTLMQIRVSALTGSPDPYDFAETLNLLNKALPIAFNDTQPPLLSQDEGSFVPGGLGKTLNEDFDKYGRLTQLLGTTTQNGLNNEGNATWGRDYLQMPPTETASQGETQIWNIYNRTGDTHPIHFHLVNVQIISRAPFDAATPDYNTIGTPRPPDANERGWKDTVRCNPGEVTQVIMKFEAPAPPEWISMKTSPRTGGYEYVWHCHILEHEEHDMMRPLVIIADDPTAVLLAAFNAKPGNNEVTLTWKTGDETDNLGFNIYRAENMNGNYVKLNFTIIQPKVGSGAGTSYRYIDDSAKNTKTYYYKLEDIDLYGKSTMHGPVSATPMLIYGIGK